MLVLTRKVGESIKIGDDVIVTVVRGIGHENKVRLGIEAPRHISLVRTELIEEDKEGSRSPATE